MKPRLIPPILLSSALVLGAVASQPALAAPTPRFMLVTDTASEDSNEVAQDVANVIGAVYAVAAGPTEVLGSEPHLEELSEELTGEEVAATLADDLPLSAEAQESIAELTDELSETLNQTELDPEAASIDDGAETLSRVVAPVDVQTTQDTATGDLIHEVSTSLTSLDKNAIETVELIETIAIADATTGEITSLQQLATEDYIAAGEIDSSAGPDDGLEATTGEIEPAASLSAQFRSGVSSSNKTKIAQYAVKYAVTPNKNYRVMTADCTNFISQAVTAGSWKQKTGWYQDNQNWWYNGLNQTWTWGGAENWYQFARNKSKRTKATTAAGLVVGDIVQVKYKGDKVINHSMVVTAKVGSTVYVSYHSRNVKNKKLSEFMKTYSGETYFYHKL